jgi:hypothetical protein
MGGLLLILPLAAFDLWLSCTTGRRQLARWREQKNWRLPAAAAAAGLLLAVWLSFLVEYGGGSQLRCGASPFPWPSFTLTEKHGCACRLSRPCLS